MAGTVRGNIFTIVRQQSEFKNASMTKSNFVAFLPKKLFVQLEKLIFI